MDRRHRVEEALERARQRMPDRPVIRHVEFDFYEEGSSSGHGRPDAEYRAEPEHADAVWVRVILDESTTDSDRDWTHIRPLDRVIREELAQADSELFPYIDFLKPTELEVDA